MSPVMDGAGELEGKTVLVTFGYAKAIWAGVMGFISPGVTYMLAQVLPGGDGVIAGNDWWIAGLFCLAGATVAAVPVAAVTNRPKVRELPPGA